MIIDDCYKKIDAYLSRDTSESLIINVNNQWDLDCIKSRYKVAGNTFISASDYCNYDEVLQLEKLYHQLSSVFGITFLTGFTSLMRLFGNDELKNELKSLINIKTSGKLIIICYQCEAFLNVIDPKVRRRICIVDGVKAEFAKLVFTSKQLPLPNHEIVMDGISKIADCIETCDASIVYIITEKSKSSFKSSVYDIEDMKKSFNIFALKCPNTILTENLGTESQWTYIVSLMENYELIEDLLSAEFGGYDNLDKFINNWSMYDENKKWLYYIGLKLFGSKSNWCINYAIANSNSVGGFIKEIYRGILTEPHDSYGFWEKYNERKQIIIALGNSMEDAIDYCGYVKSKKENALFYLTDNSQKEKELIIEFFNDYPEVFSYDDMKLILENIYPDLARYLVNYDFGNDFVNNYFKEYKQQKIINRINDEFINTVEQQAIERNYNELFQSRSSVVESIDCTDSQAFFFDALGVEYLGYIFSKCQQYNMFAKAKTCRCELPSITPCNKEFIDYFNYNCIGAINNIKALDEIKHHGEDNFDYQKTKLPLHLIRELEIIDENLKKIQSALLNRTYQKAIIVSDHGATRLAVIYEHSLSLDVDSKGTHGGRVCAYNDDIISQVPQATKVDDYLIIANYDRFKGGRAASVETHGGATLEEVIVPIIEIELKSANIDICIVTNTIKLRRNKPTILSLYSNVELKDLSVHIKDKRYYASTTDGQNFHVDISDIKKAGTYKFDLYVSNNLIHPNMSFTIESAMAQENDMFGSLFN